MSPGPTQPNPPDAPGTTPPATPDYSQRVTYTYMVGVYLAVNALRDAYVLVEGPDCAHMKTQYVQGNHDWLSTLTSVSGFHRVANTALHPARMTGSREEAVQAQLTEIASHAGVGGMLLTSMPMAFLTGADYSRLCKDVAAATGKAVVHVPGKSLSGDWMDGYAESLLALARQLDLSGGTPAPNKVGIVGYLFDRNEDDHRANVKEIKRLLNALGLEVASIWLEGQDFADLNDIKDAGVILSFPYARKAARLVARRTGARLVECELPFGLEATERWLRQVAQATGREQLVQPLLDAELSDVVPRLEWVIPYLFQNRSLGFVGDPVLARGVHEVAQILGVRTAFVVVSNPPHSLGDLAQHLGPEVPLLVYPHMKTLMQFANGFASDRGRGVDLIVANNSFVGSTESTLVEFGFPSLYTHCLFDRPFVGFRGFLGFVDQLAHAIRWYEVAQYARAKEPNRPQVGEPVVQAMAEKPEPWMPRTLPSDRGPQRSMP
jgi:nitrogenase molybdenum-iron protein alpha/beta subunit